MHSALALAAVLTGLICTNVFAAVGRTPGEFEVSPNGSAQYSIPLWVPPGIRGIQPKLALVYDSHLSYGIMGPGWTLSGLSTIARCIKTHAQDGSPAPIALTAADGLCLDGNRLRTTGTGVYQTEVANFSQVTASGNAGNGPSYFTVQGKDGLTYEYGNTTDSKILPSSGSTPYIWALDKVTDRAGNQMTFTYYQTGGAYVPLSIQYTEPSGSTSFPYQVNFGYTTKSANDKLSKYVAGSQIQQTEQLSTITMTSSGTTVREYKLSYSTSATTLRATLTTIEECGGSAASDCLSPTSVVYQGATASTAGIASPTTASGSGATNGTVYSVDIDGDGRQDLVFATTNSAGNYVWWAQLSTGSGYGTPINTGAVTVGTTDFLLDDFDALGGTEILAPVGTTWNVYKYNPSTNEFTATPTTISVVTGAQYSSADVDGDGRPDIVYLTAGSAVTAAVQFNTSAAGTISFNSTPTMTSLGGCPFKCTLYGNNQLQNSSIKHFDFDGDGRQDLIYTAVAGSKGANIYALLSRGNAGFVLGATTGTLPNLSPLMAVNWNDDACTDLVVTNYVIVFPCNGSPESFISLGANPIAALDWDGDGRTDIIVAGSGGSWQVIRSEGTTTIPAALPTGIIAGSGNWIITDQNGDGLDDLAFANSTASYAIDYGLHNGAGQPPDLAVSFADGFGNWATPSYVALPQASTSVFTKGAAKTYPQLAYVGPLYITSSAVLSDGIGGNYTLNFQYNQAVVNLQGRGFAGFGSRRIQDSRNGLFRYIHYNTDFPWIGFVTADGTTQSNTTKQITNYVTHLSSLTLDATANNERYFPYVDTATSTQYELGGAEDATLITTSVTSYEAPDYYGNFAVVATTLTDNDPGSPYSVNNWSTATENTITPDTSTWCLNLPTQTKVTNSTTVAGGAPITRTVAYNNPDYVNCRQTEKVIDRIAQPTRLLRTTVGTRISAILVIYTPSR